jgi:hypothetical protein
MSKHVDFSKYNLMLRCKIKHGIEPVKDVIEIVYVDGAERCMVKLIDLFVDKRPMFCLDGKFHDDFFICATLDVIKPDYSTVRVESGFCSMEVWQYTHLELADNILHCDDVEEAYPAIGEALQELASVIAQSR